MDIIVGQVSKDEVARYYIQCELENLLKGNIELADDAYHANIPRLLEALSFTYRANSVFDYVESDKYLWQKATVNIDDILLTGMGESLTQIIYSEEIHQNPRLFCDYLKKQFDDSSANIKNIFEQMKPRPVPRERQLILLRSDKEGELKILDGSHRLISLIMDGASEVDAYIAVLAYKDAKSMLGDAIFLRLRRVWQESKSDAYRQSIEDVVAGLMSSSTDGKQAVQSYWVSMGPTAEVREAGMRLLDIFD